MTADEIQAIAKAVAAELASIDAKYPRAMTLAEAAQYALGDATKKHEIRRAVEAGKIPLLRGGRSWLVARIAVDAWLAGTTATAAA